MCRNRNGLTYANGTASMCGPLMAIISTTRIIYPRFFTDYKVHPKHDLDGLTAGEAAARIDKALKDIYLEPLYVLRGKYNPPNYWGSVDSAIAWLKLIYDYCREHPDYIVRERS